MFSRAPTPLNVVNNIAHTFLLYISRTRFCYTYRVRVMRLLKTTSLRVSLNLELPRDIFQEYEPFFENFHNLHHLHHSFCYAGVTLRTSSMVEEHSG